MSKVILITGTSTGFGRAAAETLARRGYHVFATMRDIAGRNATARKELQSLAAQEGRNLEVLDMDVTNDASVDRAVQQALDRAGRIDVAINNAGIAAQGVTEAFPIEQYQQVFDVNVYGAARVNRAVLPSMRRQRSGLLIHVSSGAGRAVLPGFAVYCASKFALEALADAYRYDLAAFGIESVLVEPGMHRTPILENFSFAKDKERAAEYGSTAAAIERVKAIFDKASSSAETPGPEAVVDAFVRLIETPAGERPFRTVPTAALQSALEPYNEMAKTVREGIAQRFQLPDELLVVKVAPSQTAKG